MKEKLLIMVINFIFKYLKSDDVKEAIDALLDKVEEKIYADGEITGAKEHILNGLCKLSRSSFSVPDDDEVHG